MAELLSLKPYAATMEVSLELPLITMQVVLCFGPFNSLEKAEEWTGEVERLHRGIETEEVSKSGEVFDAKVSVGHGVRVGQSIEQWERQFGRPTCRPEQVSPFGRERFAYEWEASYFACNEDKAYPCAGAYEVELHIDGSGTVTRMTWSLASMH